MDNKIESNVESSCLAYSVHIPKRKENIYKINKDISLKNKMAASLLWTQESFLWLRSLN